MTAIYKAKRNVMCRCIKFGGYSWQEVQKDQSLVYRRVLREDPKFVELKDSFTGECYFMTNKQLDRNFDLISTP
jgi:hypothetical protein